MFYFLIIFLTDKLASKLHQIQLTENLASLKTQMLPGAEDGVAEFSPPLGKAEETCFEQNQQKLF